MSPDHAPSGRTFRESLLAMLGLCCVLILVALDQTVIGTSLPTIVRELQGFALYAWVGTSYLLASVVAVPIFGKLGDEHGRKPFVLAGIIVFTGASILCGAAQTMLELVLARAMQGIGGGMLVASAFACVPDLFPLPRDRLRWQVMLSTSFGLANAVGPSLGGYICEYWGWRWVFLVNLPVGMMSVYFVARHLPLMRHGKGEPSPLDVPGAVLVAGLLGSLQLLVEWWPQHKPAAELMTLALVCGASLAGLVWWEPRCRHPLLPVRLLSSGPMQTLFGLSTLVGFSMFAVMYYTPLMFQGGFKLSPNEAGMLVTPFAVSITFGSIINGRVVTRLRHPHRMLMVGALAFWVTAACLARIEADTAHLRVMLIMALGGLGIGVLLPNMTLFTQALAARTELGVATAMLQSTRMIGSMLGTAIVGVLVTQRYEAQVQSMLQSQGQLAMLSWLRDPQILVDPKRVLAFSHALANPAHAEGLLSQARRCLIAAVHSGQWLVVLVMVAVLLLCARVPSVELRAAPVATPPQGDAPADGTPQA